MHWILFFFITIFMLTPGWPGYVAGVCALAIVILSFFKGANNRES